MTTHSNDDAAWLSLFRQHMDEICNRLFHIRDQGCGLHEFIPAIDIYESFQQYVIVIDLPGFSEKDFSVTAFSGMVRIEGTKRQEKHNPAVNFICLERHFGRFSRNVEIPAAFDPGRLQKSFDRGVLVLRIARKLKV